MVFLLEVQEVHTLGDIWRVRFSDSGLERSRPVEGPAGGGEFWRIWRFAMGLERRTGVVGAAAGRRGDRRSHCLEGRESSLGPRLRGETGLGGAVALNYRGFPNWAPAFAGVVLIVLHCFLRGPTRSSG